MAAFKLSNKAKFLIAVLGTIGIGSLGGLFTISEIPTWYSGLNKPSFNPPNSVFGPVWTLLYTLMGISLFLIWKLPASAERNRSLKIFGVQFALNFCWSLIFFRFHLIGWALVEIMLMWGCILFTILFFWKQSRTAALLLVPYIFWVSFATILTAAIYRLN
ncbi:MAG: tryptophan-rich sensory protein [Sediminibacterium sp.]|nr:tryptophan-rich sensory protein [Sediminibacterium sp.]